MQLLKQGRATAAWRQTTTEATSIPLDEHEHAAAARTTTKILDALLSMILACLRCGASKSLQLLDKL